MAVKAWKKGLTKAQIAAVEAYNFALREEDRYLGSVFVTPIGQRKQEAKTHQAYEKAKRLGVSHLC